MNEFDKIMLDFEASRLEINTSRAQRAIKDAKRNQFFNRMQAGLFVFIAISYIIIAVASESSPFYAIAALIWLAGGGMFFWLSRRYNTIIEAETATRDASFEEEKRFKKRIAEMQEADQ
jgi:hypothetical protein